MIEHQHLNAELLKHRIAGNTADADEAIDFSPETLSDLGESEEHHFWSKVRRSLVITLIRRFCPKPETLLDVGCGNGSLVRALEENFRNASVSGMDGYLRALVNCRMRSATATLYFQNIARIPWIDTGPPYDAITFVDVLEHVDRPEDVLREASKRLSADGIIILSLPAREELWSERDVHFGHRRRFTKDTLRSLVESGGLEILTMNYLFLTLYIPMWLFRIGLRPVLRISQKQADKIELATLPVLNAMLTLIGLTEILIGTLLPLPAGTSVYCVARKR